MDAKVIKVKAKCGCLLESHPVRVNKKSKYHEVDYIIKRWTISDPCKAHATNYAKKSEKIFRKINRKRGKGYTRKGNKK
jgi:hypothetical protein